MVREFTCIMCPLGCDLRAETGQGADGNDIIVTGNTCKKGMEYAVQELTDPQRNIATSVLVLGGEIPLASVRLTSPIPKELIFPAMEEIKKIDCDGYAIGGLAVGEPTETMYEMIEVVDAILPEDRPRYLMGVGTPVNILEGIARGVDMFDCVMPTRNGRNGQLFTAEGIINIRNKKWEDDFSPIDPQGTAFVDTLYSKAYLHHLCVCGEMLAAEIASLHNIAFYLRLVGMARGHIAAGDFKPWKEAMVAKLSRRL